MKYVALLRGINVGGNRKVPMAELQLVFETMGFSNVVTYINSGNVVFDSHRVPDADRIARQIEQSFGFLVSTLVIDGDMIQKIASKIPQDWTNDSKQKSDVMYLFPEVDNPDVITMIGPNPQIETCLYTPGALLYNIPRQDQAKSSLIKIVGTNLYKRVTVRNCNTARRLAELCANVTRSD